MANELNHIIVHCRNRRKSAAFPAELMDAPARANGACSPRCSIPAARV
ncbi:hypothetical protein ACH4TX_45005 [Streptomyces sp. NPDC021098]